jgi:hypothetical protein
MKLIEVVKELVQTFWHNNTIPSSNKKDVLKLRRSFRGHESHIKHFIDSTQEELYDRFKNEHKALKLGQIYFEKWMPWYVIINILGNMCCYRYQIKNKK